LEDRGFVRWHRVDDGHPDTCKMKAARSRGLLERGREAPSNSGQRRRRAARRTRRGSVSRARAGRGTVCARQSSPCALPWAETRSS
jgi:hypothetical protein